MKVWIVILFIIVTVNFYFDTVIDGMQTKTLGHISQVTKIHQKILGIHNDRLEEIGVFENKLYVMNYQIASLAILTKLQCDIERAERLNAEELLEEEE